MATGPGETKTSTYRYQIWFLFDLLHPQITILSGLGRKVKKGKHTLSNVSHAFCSLILLAGSYYETQDGPEFVILLPRFLED